MNAFVIWYNRFGHWMHESIKEAHQAWATRGIDGLPAWSGESYEATLAAYRAKHPNGATE